MHKYDGVKAGPKCNDIIELMRGEHGIEVSKSLAWDAREYAINTMRGISRNRLCEDSQILVHDEGS